MQWTIPSLLYQIRRHNPLVYKRLIRDWRCETDLSLPVKYITDRSKAVLPLWIFYGFFCLVFTMPLCASVYALWSPVGKGLGVAFTREHKT